METANIVALWVGWLVIGFSALCIYVLVVGGLLAVACRKFGMFDALDAWKLFLKSKGVDGV